MREVAQEERAELGLSATDRFDPYALAEAHGIKVYTLSDLRQYDLGVQALHHFTEQDSSAWSAALVPFGTARIIIENETHAPARRRSNIAHELGHHLLEHPFDGVIFGENHKRQFNDKQEKQATFMAGELLIPLAAAARMAYAGWDNQRVADAYGVSPQFAQMQMKGQRVRAQRAARKYGFSSPVIRQQR
ncbi:ImmA/IrrE family metallo-endopeptidase [Actinoallomurus soli]|uniref:ImmA/IrrE family metallo-endopeptidase n=1 Tax=Actinoallomurus soli TaxID=2952535 RepID=UPI00209395CF|nr:ImmA/IrrE family metallo-endopeptidase [Actinoallomurus soli]MCO5974828.1 ImmA/IrrE family metallo-endopeptidase [Actinoallomurus soli]